MLKICVLVLVLQIEFNAALNNGGYNTNPLIPQSRSMRYGQSRRNWNSNRYQPETSERIASSESDESDSEETSLEETSSRSQRSQNNYPYQRNNNQRYNSRTLNDVSLETPPIGRFGLNYRSDISSNRADTDFRRPYLRHRPLNRRRAQNRKYRRKEESDASPVKGLAAATESEDANYLRSLLSLFEQPNLRHDQSRKYYRKGADLSLEISPDSLESDDDASSSLPRSQAADTQFLDSSLELPNYRRIGKNLDKLRIKKLMLDNENSNTNPRRSLLSSRQSPNYRRNNWKRNRNSDYEVRFQIPSATDNPDAYIDTVFLVSGEGKPDDIAVARPQLRKSGGTNLNKNKKYYRRYDDSSTFELSSDDRLSADDDALSDLSAFDGLKTNLRYRKLTKVKNYDNNVGFDSNDRLSSDDDDNDKIKVLGLASLDDMNLESPQLRSHDQRQQKNKQYTGRSFLRLALSPNEKLSLDEDMALSLSELLSENLDNLKLFPVSLRSNKPTNGKNRRTYDDDTKLALSLDDKISSEDDTPSNLSLESLDDLSIESPVMRNFIPNKNKKSIKDDNNFGLTLLLTDAIKNNNNPVDNLVPYHEFSPKTNNDTKNEKSNNTRRNNNNLNLSLLNEREDNDDDNSKIVLPLIDRLELDDDLEENSTVLRLDSSDETSGLQSSNENQSNEHDTTDVLHLEFPWNDQLSSNDNKGNKLTSFNGSKSRLRNRDPTRQRINPKDYELKLEFPWNDQLSPDDKSGKDLTNRGLRNRDQIHRQNIDPKDYELNLEFPWNDQLNPDYESGEDSTKRGLKAKLRNREQSNRQSTDPKDYELDLEFPWNDQLSPNKEISKDSSNRGLRTRLRNHERTDKQNVDPKDYELNLEFPWNDQLSPDNESGKDSTNRGLRNHQQIGRQNIDPKDYELNLEFPWNDQLSPDNESGKDSTNRGLRNHQQIGRQNIDPKDYELNLEFPWNDQLSPDNESGKDSTNRGLRNRQQIGRQNIDPKDYELNLEFPWNDQLSPDNESGKDSTYRGLRNRQQIGRQNIDPKDYELNLEFPWNDQLSPDDESNKDSSNRGLRYREQTDRQNIDPKNYELELEFPWNDQLSPNNEISEDSSNPGLRTRNKNHQQKDRQSIDPKDYELELEFPWNDQLSPDEDTLRVKPVNRRTRLESSHSYQRNRNRNNKINRRSNNYLYNNNNLHKGLGNSQMDLSYLRRSDGSLKDDQSLRVLSIARRGLDKNTMSRARSELRSSNEPDSSSITFPLDRRPHLRVGNQNNAYNALNLSRRAYTPLATTTPSPKVTRVGTYNDTIIFPKN